MDSVLDFLFLRRLKFEYTSPPICPLALASASGFGITGQVISPILALGAPVIINSFILLPCSESTIAFNVYQAEQIGNPDGAFTPLVEGIQPPTVSVCQAGTYVANPLNASGQILDTFTFVCDGVNRLNQTLPAPSGTINYNLYQDGVLVLSHFVCGAVQICVGNCFSITAITGDGETPLSPPTCTVPPQPIIQITSPSNGASFIGGATVPVIALAALNGHTPDYVEFFDGTTSLGTTAVSPYTVSFMIASGSHTLTAVLHYDGGSQVTSDPVTISASVSLPALGDIIQWLDSSDFDSTPAGTDVTLWADKSGYVHDMFHEPGFGGISGSDFPPTVDQTVTLNGHATVKFVGSGNGQSLRSTSLFLPALAITGMELFVVFSKATGDDHSAVYSYNRYSNNFILLFSAWWSLTPPQTDNNNAFGSPNAWYEYFGHTQEHFDQHGPKNFGVPPGWSMDTPHIINVSSQADGSELRAAFDGIPFYSESGTYTYSNSGTEATASAPDNVYTLGSSVNYGLGGNFTYMTGNIAAVYLWRRVLTPAERAQALSYINGLWGI